MIIRNKIKYAKAFLSLGLVMLCMGTGGCEKTKNKYTDYSFDYFDTVSIITGYETDEEEFKNTVKGIYEVLDKCHKQYDIYYSYEGVNNVLLINSINPSTNEHNRVTVEQETWDMLTFAKSMYELTKGKTNVAMGSVLRLWHDARVYGESNPDKAYLPDMNKLKEAALHVSFDSIEFDSETKSIFIADNSQFLDVGAVAKGYAIELAAKYLEDNGKSGYCLNIGGNIRTIGGKPAKDSNEPIEKWGAGIENPYYDREKDSAENAYISIVYFNDKALATSGSYQRYYYVNGKAYHHIIDPDTLMPENRWVSVTVLSDDAGYSDALSTALFNMSLEEGLELIESLPGVEAIWMSPAPECNITKSSGFSEYEKQ